MKKTDITIIGSDFFGVHAAILLSNQGYSISLVMNKKSSLFNINSLDILWPSLNDAPTRIDVAHGHDVACYLNDFCKFGVELFKAQFFNDIKIQNLWQKSICLRVGLQAFEQDELKIASNLGFGLNPTSKKEIFLEKHSSYICKDIELYEKEILTLLNKKKVNLIYENVLSLKEEIIGCKLQFETQTLESEIVVFANSYQISNFLPHYKSILVPMSDTIFEYECASVKKCEPISFRAFNGHVAACLYQDNNKTYLRVSGPRFLLPQAGAGLILKKEQLNIEMINKISNFHKEIFSILSLHYDYSSVELFLNDFQFKIKNNKLVVDCYPCDELPLVGEFGKLGKILGCTGFLGTDFSAGIWGAKIISDLICHQNTKDLHVRMKPRRFYNSGRYT